MFNEKKFKFDIENLKQDLAIEDMYVTEEDILQRYHTDYQHVLSYETLLVYIFMDLITSKFHNNQIYYTLYLRKNKIKFLYTKK